MVYNRKNQFRNLFFYPIVGYIVYRTFFYSSANSEINEITEPLCKDGSKSTLSKSKLTEMANYIESISESVMNQVFNTKYTETLNVLKALQNDCDVYALQLTYGERNTGWTRKYDLGGVLNYIFGDGNDIGIVNNWFARNRPNISYRF